MNGENVEQIRDEMANDEQVRAKISQRAYEIYLSRGGEPGSAMDDWLKAESEVLASSTEVQPPAVEDAETKGEGVK